MNNTKYIGIYDVLDIACADALSVDVPLWIDVIESFSFRRMEVVLAHILNGDQKKREQVCRIFHAQLHRVSDRSGTPQAGNPAEEYSEERGPRNEGDAQTP